MTDLPIEVTLHPALVPVFKQWLEDRGLELRFYEKANDDHLDIWMVTPTEAAMRRFDEPLGDSGSDSPH